MKHAAAKSTAKTVLTAQKRSIKETAKSKKTAPQTQKILNKKSTARKPTTTIKTSSSQTPKQKNKEKFQKTSTKTKSASASQPNAIMRKKASSIQIDVKPKKAVKKLVIPEKLPKAANKNAESKTTATVNKTKKAVIKKNQQPIAVKKNSQAKPSKKTVEKKHSPVKKVVAIKPVNSKLKKQAQDKTSKISSKKTAIKKLKNTIKPNAVKVGKHSITLVNKGNSVAKRVKTASSKLAGSKKKVNKNALVASKKKLVITESKKIKNDLQKNIPNKRAAAKKIPKMMPLKIAAAKKIQNKKKVVEQVARVSKEKKIRPENNILLTKKEIFLKALAEKSAASAEKLKQKKDALKAAKKIKNDSAQQAKDAAEKVKNPQNAEAKKTQKKNFKPICSAILRGRNKSYQFEVFPLEASFSFLPAIYVISRRITDHKRRGHHKLICIGQTDSIADAIKSHRRESCIKKHEANVICVLREENEIKRQKIESDLKAAHTINCVRQ